MPVHRHWKSWKIRHLSTLILMTGLLLLISSNAAQASNTVEYLEVIKLQHAGDVINRYETVNITLTISNLYDGPIRNISFTDNYDNDLMYVQDSLNDTQFYNESSAEVSWRWNLLNPGQIVEFWTLLNFTTNQSQQITLTPTNITFYIEYGIPVTVYSNILEFNFEYIPDVTEGAEVKARIEGDIDLGPVIPIIGLLLPVVIAVVAYISIRKGQ
ncbi:MAG: hypothetical protein ACFFD4_25555 [Candidatus Odinarchaeota archaeon]